MKRVLLLWVGLILAGASAQAADTAPNASYKLQPGDVLQVVVWKETDLQSEVLIRPDGEERGNHRADHQGKRHGDHQRRQEPALRCRGARTRDR